MHVCRTLRYWLPGYDVGAYCLEEALIHAQPSILLPCSLFSLFTTRNALNDMAG